MTMTRTGTLTEQQSRAKDAFIRVHGEWNDAWESLLRLDTGFFNGMWISPRCRGRRITSLTK
jgi:hypothetical protein